MLLYKISALWVIITWAYCMYRSPPPVICRDLFPLIWQKLQIVPSPTYTMFFPIHTFLRNEEKGARIRGKEGHHCKRFRAWEKNTPPEKGGTEKKLPFWNLRGILWIYWHRSTDLKTCHHSFLSKILICVCMNEWVIINPCYLSLNLVQWGNKQLLLECHGIKDFFSIWRKRKSLEFKH